IGGREGEADAAQLAVGQALLGLQPAPARAAVPAHVQAAAGTARLHAPRRAPELPHAGEQVVGGLRVHRQIAATGGAVDGEHLLPAPAAVGGLEHAALAVVLPRRAGGADESGVAPARVELDARHVLGLLEAEVLPGLAAVARAVDAVAVRDAVAQVRLAGAHP